MCGVSVGRGSSEDVPPYVDGVLEIVDRIPMGKVLSYGDVAELAGHGGARLVGRVMAIWGGAVPWWRVVRADGRPATGHEQEALKRLRSDGAPLRADRVDMRAARWDGRRS